MSHPNPTHDRDNEYPEDKVSRYPQKKKRKTVDLDDVGGKVGAKAQALKKMCK